MTKIIEDIIDYAIEQKIDPVEAVYDYYDECGSQVKISYDRAAQIVKCSQFKSTENNE